jgi:hypothetical protein
MNTEHTEVADIFRLYGQTFRQNNPISNTQRKAMRHIELCRSAALGGHVEQCNLCGFERISYNSCRDRHCPKCQTLVKEKWLDDRKSELLPCGYFHLVFTLPHELNPIILTNKKVALGILFSAVNQTLQAFARDPRWRLEGQLGFILVLHTWSQTLMDHFHLHCLVPAGALSLDQKSWRPARSSFLFRVGSLAKAFRKRYLLLLKAARHKQELIFPGNTSCYATQKAFDSLIESLSRHTWIVYAKRPFAGPEQVLEYLGRYTHRIAISNNRIKSIDDGKVIFTYRDRADKDQIKEMTLSAEEFIRRFLLHILPEGFMKIRYFGFLSNKNKKEAIPLIRKLIGWKKDLPAQLKETVTEMILRLTGEDLTCCPRCLKGRMQLVRTMPQAMWNSS